MSFECTSKTYTRSKKKQDCTILQWMGKSLSKWTEITGYDWSSKTEFLKQFAKMETFENHTLN